MNTVRTLDLTLWLALPFSWRRLFFSTVEQQLATYPVLNSTTLWLLRINCGFLALDKGFGVLTQSFCFKKPAFCKSKRLVLRLFCFSRDLKNYCEIQNSRQWSICSMLYQTLPFPRTKTLDSRSILKGYEDEKTWNYWKGKKNPQEIIYNSLLCSLAQDSLPFGSRGPLLSCQWHCSMLPCAFYIPATTDFSTCNSQEHQARGWYCAFACAVSFSLKGPLFKMVSSFY